MWASGGLNTVPPRPRDNTGALRLLVLETTVALAAAGVAAPALLASLVVQRHRRVPRAPRVLEADADTTARHHPEWSRAGRAVGKTAHDE